MSDAGPDVLPGAAVTEQLLRELGFTPFELAFEAGSVSWPGAVGIKWATVGEVPDSPGLYAFTVSDGATLHVTYVGKTDHLWMVTKGLLPRGGGPRGGNRYGHPVHAGVTRKRINALVAEQVTRGRTVQHWLAPWPIERLATDEEAFIARWKLRVVGWNRG